MNRMLGYPTGKLMLDDIERVQCIAAFLRAARGGSQSVECFAVVPVQLFQAEPCCFVARDEFHCILLLLDQEAPDRPEPFGPVPVTIIGV